MKRRECESSTVANQFSHSITSRAHVKTKIPSVYFGSFLFAFVEQINIIGIISLLAASLFCRIIAFTVPYLSPSSRSLLLLISLSFLSSLALSLYRSISFPILALFLCTIRLSCIFCRWHFGSIYSKPDNTSWYHRFFHVYMTDCRAYKQIGLCTNVRLLVLPVIDVFVIYEKQKQAVDVIKMWDFFWFYICWLQHLFDSSPSSFNIYRI